MALVAGILLFLVGFAMLTAGVALLIGGDITFKGYRDGRVYLNMKGACSGCPSSTATLKHGVQKLLHHFVPEVQEVEAVM